MDGRTNVHPNADTHRGSRLVATTPQAGGEAGNPLGGGIRMVSRTARTTPKERRALSPSGVSGPFRRLRRHSGRSGSVGSLEDLPGVAGLVSSGRGFSVAGEDAEISMEVPVMNRSLRPAAPFNDADSGGDDDETSTPSMGTDGGATWSSSRKEAGGGGGGGKAHRGPASIVKNMARRLKERSMGSSGAMTIGRASFVGGGGSVQREGLGSLPDFDEGRGDEPLHSASYRRKLPAEWHRSVPSTAVLTPSESSSAGPSPPPRQHQHCNSIADPNTMARGVSAPSVTHSPHRRLSGSPIGGWQQQQQPQQPQSQSQPRPQTLETPRREADAAGMGQETAAATSATEAESAETASTVAAKSRRLSVGSRRSGRRSSLSPTRRLVAGVAAVVAAGVRGGGERDRSTSPKRGDEHVRVLEGNTPAAGDNYSEAPTVDPSEGSTAEKPDRRVSWQAGQGFTGIGGCIVEPAPPSTLKYGDRLRLWARSLSPDAVLVPSEGVSVSGGDVPSPCGGGYVGSLDKVFRVKQRLFRRSETAAINRSCGTVRGFVDCHFKAVDPEGRHSEGDDVLLGETVLLVDDRGFVWNYNTTGNASTVRMKPRDSAKHQAAVCFRIPNGDAQPVGDTPVVFGHDDLEIIPVDQSSCRESRRRRVGSRKYQHHALTAYTNKSGGSSRGSVAVLCGDGRGDQVVFEVHLPNASPAGDPSPVVTKVIIHANELQALAAPPTAEDDEEEVLSSEASPMPTPMPGSASGEQAASQPRPRSGSVVSSGRARGGSSGDAEPLGLMPPLELRHRRGVVGSNISSGSKARGIESQSQSLEVGSYSAYPVYPTSEGYHCRGSSVTATSSVRAGSVVDGEDDEDAEDESAMGEVAELGAFEGLKWGEFVQFKLPGEGEVLPDDPMLTIMLSNGFSVSLTSKQLRENAGRDRFPVAANRLKSVTERDAPSDVEGGTVYLCCSLTPLVGCHETVARAGVGPSIDGDSREGIRAQGSIAGGGDVSTGPGKAVIKWETGKRWTQKSGSIIFLLASAAAIIVSAPAMSSNFLGNFSTLSSSSYGPAAAVTTTGTSSDTKPGPPSCSSPTSPSPSVCTSVWDLRQPDGTEYPHQQLSAAAAAFESAGSSPAPAAPAAADRASSLGQRKKGMPSSDSAGGGAQSSITQDTSFAGSAARHGDGSAGGGRSGAGTAAESGVAITSAGGGVSTRGTEASEGTGGGWARACTIAVAILAAGVVAVDRLFGFRWAGSAHAPPARAPPMQARVHLLEWDGRSISETRAAAEASLEDGICHTPPSGSGLAPMPNRFALAENMNMAKAWARWEATLTWRNENAVDSLLSKPHPRFSLIKSLYPHCFHLPDKGGRVTYYERPGLSDFGELKKAGISKEDLVEHYVYCMEYLWQVLQPKQSQKVTVIIDLVGVRFRDLAGESVGFLKTTVGIMSRHYPQRSFKILILNAPSFFNYIFAMVKPLLNESTKKKIEMLPVSTAERGMLEVIPPENLPPQYGGNSQVPLLESPAEAALLAHVVNVLEKNGLTMEPVAP